MYHFYMAMKHLLKLGFKAYSPKKNIDFQQIINNI